MFHWLVFHYAFLIVGIPGILGAIWKWILKPLKKLYCAVKAWAEEDKAAKIDLRGFIVQWTPNSGSSGWDRLKRIEEGLGLQQSIMATRDKLDHISRFSCDEHGRVISANRSFCRYFNITDDVAIGWGWLNLFSPEGSVRDDFKMKWQASVEAEVEFSCLVRTNPHYGQNGPQIEILAYPVRENATGRVVRWDGIIQKPAETS